MPTVDTSILHYFFQAGWVVRIVMLLLIGASVFSWMCIFERYYVIRQAQRATEQFEKQFWSGEDLNQLHQQLAKHKEGLFSIFSAGFKEFLRFRKQVHSSSQDLFHNTKRALASAQMREQNRLEKQLPFLAMVASTSPYVGLFGTVWGIMQAFRGIASSQQATIAMVAPGIAEALVATAMGLLAAIPAVIAYNRFSSEINELLTRFEAFQEEFTNILVRQTQMANTNTRATEIA